MKGDISRRLRWVFFLPILYFLNGCFSSEDERLNTLYRQRIPNSNYVIYDFSYAGSFVTSSDYRGLTILDSNSRFAFKKIDKLPSSYFSDLSSVDNLKMIQINFDRRTEKDTSLSPLRVYDVASAGHKIKVTEYNDTYGSAVNTGLQEFNFLNIEETADSLKFYKVAYKDNKEFFKPHISFPKGNIKIISDSTDSEVLRIEIEEAIVGRGEIYKPSAPLTLVSNQPVIGFKTYHFIPQSKLKITSLSDFGIYKPIKLKMY